MINKLAIHILLAVLLVFSSGNGTYAQKIYWGEEVPKDWNGHWQGKFLTTTEKTGFERTASSMEVLEFIENMKWISGFVQVIDLFTSDLGRVCPAVVLADPRINSAAEAKKSGKPVIYLQGNIHPPEAEGKEALMMVIRDILVGSKRHLLDNQIIIICPNFNVDGNDILSIQDGTPYLIGSGTTSKGYNLNRDAIKLESTEANGLYKNVLNAWDPVLFFDAHAMERVKHGYAICYATCNLPTANPEPPDYIWNSLFPAVREKVRDNYGLETFTHCLSDEENWPPTVWSHDLAYWFIEGKFLTNAYGLRNRMSILVETPGFPSFERKIYAQYAYITELLEYTRLHGREMADICKKADEKVVNQVIAQSGTSRMMNFVQGKYESWGKIDILAYRNNDQEFIPGTSVLRNKPGTIDGVPEIIKGVEHLTKPVGTKEAAMPRGYLIPGSFGFLVNKLIAQNIRIDTLKSPLTVSGEEFLIDSLYHQRSYEFILTRYKGGFVHADRRTFPAGTFLIDMAQPLANLIFFCLEPEVGDGFAGWGLLDPFLVSAGVENKSVAYPIFKYFKILN